MEKILLTNQVMGSKFLFALKAKYQAQVAESESILNVYFNNPAGIGEHSDLIDEFDKHLEKLTSAQDKLDYLNSQIEILK